jgi:hypothetical protein
MALVARARWSSRSAKAAGPKQEGPRAAGASRIDLTANDEKQPGRALYRSLGFQRRDTSSFRLDLTEPTAAIRR